MNYIIPFYLQNGAPRIMLPGLDPPKGIQMARKPSAARVIEKPTEPAPMLAAVVGPPVQSLTPEQVARLLDLLKTLDEAPPAPADKEPPPAPVLDAPQIAARVGLSVVYRLNVRDVDTIMARRVKHAARGNPPVSGDPHAAMIVAVSSADVASLVVFLDGEDSLWAQHRPRGVGLGHWRPA